MEKQFELRKTHYAQWLHSYIPSFSVEYVAELIAAYDLLFFVSNPRKTKHGDYRAPRNGSPHLITINSNLNPYAFLVTSIHELAHLTTFEKFGKRVQPHGREWKNEFKRLLIPLLKTEQLPSEIQQALLNSLDNMKASSLSDIPLSMALKKYDTPQKNHVLLAELPAQTHFLLNNKIFKREYLRRSRYLCTDVKTGKQYLVHKLAEVKPIKEEE